MKKNEPCFNIFNNANDDIYTVSALSTIGESFPGVLAPAPCKSWLKLMMK